MVKSRNPPFEAEYFGDTVHLAKDIENSSMED